MLLQLLDFALVLLSFGAVFIIPGYSLFQMRAVMQGKGYAPHVAHLYLTVASVAGVIVAYFAINFAWGFQTHLGGIDFVLCTVLPTAVVSLALFALTKLVPQQEGRKGGSRKTIDHQFWGRLCLGLIGVVVVGGVLAFATDIIDLKDRNIGGMKIGIWALIIFALYKYSQHLMRNAYKETVPTFEDKVETDPSPPVLYLRSFAEERLPFANVPFQEYPAYCSAPQWISLSPGIGWPVPLTFEEFFARSFEHEIGPLVALGSPEDYVMPEGAARHYAGDDDWKDRFLELINKASCIVTVVNNSSNLEWEYRQILEHGLQEKFFVFTRCFEQSRSIFAQTKNTLLSTLGKRGLRKFGQCVKW